MPLWINIKLNAVYCSDQNMHCKVTVYTVIMYSLSQFLQIHSLPLLSSVFTDWRVKFCFWISILYLSPCRSWNVSVLLSTVSLTASTVPDMVDGLPPPNLLNEWMNEWVYGWIDLLMSNIGPDSKVCQHEDCLTWALAAEIWNIFIYLTKQWNHYLPGGPFINWSSHLAVLGISPPVRICISPGRG